jgi:hypothetical protein
MEGEALGEFKNPYPGGADPPGCRGPQALGICGMEDWFL